MLLARVRRLARAHRRAWWFAALLLSLLQPFIAVHFNCDGLEDEPMLRLRGVGETTQFEADDRADHPTDRETTVFAQGPAGIHLPDTLNLGLDTLLALLLALLPLAVVLMRHAGPAGRTVPEPVPRHAGAPPPSAPWRRLPPPAAPPFAT
ncbi:hypothetical protein FFI97_016710 [Variovorax sp. KBS0712]|uniref:hypothetical protein n=1 Tax=Variovorax sp. KBS0712 TaxID=2578111 RepID=UPI00111B9071|nr:hypothetical protein [Variovorax sp. KBS0712]TSD61808.1 hypothetical protein FFI97_016710 [Variovorax sp. KBS0712]